MDAQAGDNYITFIVRLQQSEDGVCRIEVAGAFPVQLVGVTDAPLVIRLWRYRAAGVLRGRIELAGTEYWAPIQSNDQIEALVRQWLQIDS